jgi:hypothetical protein
MRNLPTALILAATLASLPAAAQTATGPAHQTCAATGPASAGERHREWIMVGWEKRRGDPAFDFRQRLGHLYHWNSGDVRLYDDFDPQYRVARSANEWAAIWTQPFSALRAARHSVMDGPDVIDGGSLSASTLEFAARLETAEGDILGVRARSSLVWQCTSDGWRIVREHISTRRVSREEIDTIVSARD